MQHKVFTLKIIIGMLLGVVVGLLLNYTPLPSNISQFITSHIFEPAGQIFIRLIKMIVIPIVLVSLICGSSALGDLKKFGRVGLKAFTLYLFTTMLAISLALVMAKFFHIGEGVKMVASTVFTPPEPASLKQIITNIIPSNPFKALAEGNMLPVIFFALLFGAAIAVSGEKARPVAAIFQSTNQVLIQLITMIMKLAPYGVFFLLATLFATQGFALIKQLAGYFIMILVVLLVQLVFVYGLFLKIIGQINPLIFFYKMRDAMLFAFSVSSSNASIPVVLDTVENKLGVKNSVASFIIPLGATINMDGTAIMQGVATVFIAHLYHIKIGIIGYLTVIGMATLASIGTAGVPSVGLITLVMVLQQVGLPVGAIGLIFGVDRLLDMARTAVNVAGDAMIACIVGKSEGALDQSIYQSELPKFLLNKKSES